MIMPLKLFPRARVPMAFPDVWNDVPGTKPLPASRASTLLRIAFVEKWAPGCRLITSYKGQISKVTW